MIAHLRFLSLQFGYALAAAIVWLLILQTHTHDSLQASLPWVFKLCLGYLLITLFFLKPLCAQLKSHKQSPYWLILATLVASISIALIDSRLLQQSAVSNTLLNPESAIKIIIHICIISIWVVIYDTHISSQYSRAIVVTEHPTYYPLIQLLGWALASSHWMLLVIATPNNDIPLLTSFYWALLLSCSSLLICHFILRPQLQELLLKSLSRNHKILSVLWLTIRCTVFLHLIEFLWISMTLNSINPIHAATLALIASLKNGQFIIWSLLYSGWLGWQQKHNESQKLQTAKANVEQLQLNQLKQQLNPHFLFNTLNSIRAMINKNPHTARNMVTDLAELLRYNLYTSQKNTVALKQEIELIEQYLAIETIRYGSRLQISYHIDDSTRECLVVPLSLQTLVENSIKHNISQSSEKLEVEIYSEIKNQQLQLRVTNNGHLKPSQNPEAIGLNNTRCRIKSIFGESSSLDITQTKKHSITANIYHSAITVLNEQH